jgi:hypothetical protein
MKKKIDKFLDNEKKYVPILAKEIIDTFQNEAGEDNVEYSFTIDGENKKIKTQEANTYFVFDTDGQNTLHEFKKALFDKDLENIEEESQEEQELMENVRNFLLQICKKMSKKYPKRLRDTVRTAVLGNKYNEKTVPLSSIEVVSIDIADYSSIPESHKFLLKVGKKPQTEIDIDEVILFIQNRQEKTGMDIDSILSIEKQVGNPLFDNVLTIELSRKFLNEISIYFFVDYSINVTKEDMENRSKKSDKTLDKPIKK